MYHGSKRDHGWIRWESRFDRSRVGFLNGVEGESTAVQFQYGAPLIRLSLEYRDIFDNEQGDVSLLGFRDISRSTNGI